jgi:hypothetical protein
MSICNDSRTAEGIFLKLEFGVLLKFGYSVQQLAVGWLAVGQCSSPGRDEILLCVIRASCGAHPASYPVGTGGSFPSVKAAGV